MSLNKVLLIGNAGADPVVRYLDIDTKMATVSIATNEHYKDKSGQSREYTEWHNIVCWNSLADAAEESVHKGSLVYVEGKLRTRSWNDAQGIRHTATEIHAESLKVLSTETAKENPHIKGKKDSSPIVIDCDDDGLPF